MSGNFVVSFDPSTDTPSSIQLVADFNDPNNNNGYFAPQTNNQATRRFGTPANVGLQSGPDSIAIRDLVWNFSSPALSPASTVGLSSTFSAGTTAFKVTSGGIDYTTTLGTASSSYVGSQDVVAPTSTWTLSEASAGSGDWTLVFDGTYPYTYNTGVTTGSLTAAATVSSTAHYAVGTTSSGTTQTGEVFNSSTGNVVTVPTPTTDPVQAQVLGGAGTTGGVTADFPATITPGTITVQEVPGITSLTQAAVEAGQANPIFALSTADNAIGAPQIWSVDFAGQLNGGSATLTFNYDPTKLPAGTDQSQLVIWHFNHITNQWEHTGAGDVNIALHQITYTTDSFSPFSLGTLAVVPEPSTIVLAGCGLLSLGIVGWRRRQAVVARSALIADLTRPPETSEPFGVEWLALFNARPSGVSGRGSTAPDRR